MATSTDLLVVAGQAALDAASDTFDWGDLSDPEYAAGACVTASVTVAHHWRTLRLAPQAHLLELRGLDRLPADICARWREEYFLYGYDPAGFMHAVVAIGDGRAFDPTARQLDRHRRRPAFAVTDETTLRATWHTATPKPLEDYGDILMFL
jgi:hypothetical protein